MDLPGSYSLVANSDEEVVTRDYIEQRRADLVCILADASQLERSLFMLADYAGIKVPEVLLLNLMDVATAQGKTIDCDAISKQIGIPVIPFIASDKKGYQAFYQLLQNKEKENWIIHENVLVNNMQCSLADTYTQILSLLPNGGISVYSSNWIIMKLLEKDQVVTDMVHLHIGEENADMLAKLCANVQDGSLVTGDSKYNWID